MKRQYTNKQYPTLKSLLQEESIIKAGDTVVVAGDLVTGYVETDMRYVFGMMI